VAAGGDSQQRRRRSAYDVHPEEGGTSLMVKIGPGPGGSDDFKLVTVLGVASPGAFGGYHQLVVQGQDHGDYLGFGKWYFVDGMVCSPKTGPGVMRVLSGFEAGKDCHEAQTSNPGADHRAVA